MRRSLLLTTALLLALAAACGGSGSADDAGDTTTVPVTAAVDDPGASSSTTASSAPASVSRDGTVLEPGELPAPWVTVTDGATVTFGALNKPDVPQASAACPAGLEKVAGASTQCTMSNDDGGAYASIRTTLGDGSSTTTLLCQEGDSLDFTEAFSLAAPLLASGPGAVDADGRTMQAQSFTVGSAPRWFVIRRPAGQDCPVIWDLGAGKGE